MKIGDLIPEVIKSETESLLKNLLEFITVDFPEPEGVHPDLLEGLVRTMDNLDSDDYFGTEGWRHRFGSNLPREE